jgi:hypothetical protein
MIKLKLLLDIESGFISAVIKVHQFSPVLVVATKQFLALSPSQMRALCILALKPLESEARISVD